MTQRSAVLLTKRVLVLGSSLEDLAFLVNRKVSFIDAGAGPIPAPPARASEPFRVFCTGLVTGDALGLFDLVVRVAPVPDAVYALYSVEIVHQSRGKAIMPDFLITAKGEMPMSIETVKAAQKKQRPVAKAAKTADPKLLTASKALIKELERPGVVIASTPAFRKAVADFVEIVQR